MGIEVSESYVRRAHVILVCGDSEESIERTVRGLDGKSSAAVLQVRTKADLLPGGAEAANAPIDSFVSAETGFGLRELLASIDDVLTASVGESVAEIPILTRTRHVRAIQDARDELTLFGNLWKETQLPAPVAAVHLQTATAALESLIGVVSTDDVLDRVFSSFCVGK
jgi:tRNA modification GTPase